MKEHNSWCGSGRVRSGVGLLVCVIYHVDGGDIISGGVVLLLCTISAVFAWLPLLLLAECVSVALLRISYSHSHSHPLKDNNLLVKIKWK